MSQLQSEDAKVNNISNKRDETSRAMSPTSATR
ncbi:hypothetical protein ACFFYR_10530 [Paraburkholderia dipogonis]